MAKEALSRRKLEVRVDRADENFHMTSGKTEETRYENGRKGIEGNEEVPKSFSMNICEGRTIFGFAFSCGRGEEMRERGV